MLIDYHLHNHFSPDSEEDTRKIVKKAISLGIQEICLTNHLEIHDRITKKSVFDLDEATERFKAIREDIAEVQRDYPQLPIRFGTELEYIEGRMEEVARFVKKTPFDFIVGSVHIVLGVIISSHLFAGELYEKTDEETAYNAYFDNLAAMVEWGHFDAVAHFDICKKIGCKFYSPFQPERYKHRIIPILKRMKEKGIGLELNSGSFEKYCMELYPHPLILEWAIEAGIENFTTGSDAHKEKRVSKHIAESLEIAKKAGIKNISTYTGRVPTRHSI